LLYLTIGADVYKSLLSLFARSKSLRGLHQAAKAVSGHAYRGEYMAVRVQSKDDLLYYIGPHFDFRIDFPICLVVIA